LLLEYRDPIPVSYITKVTREVSRLVSLPSNM
jgi:hypothetical protein